MNIRGRWRVLARTAAVTLAALVPWAGTQTHAQGEGVKTVWDGVYSAVQASRGRQLYTERCASCHAPDMNGGEMAPPLVGVAFQSNWNGLTVGDLSERIRLSMPAGAEGTLSRQQVADVIAAILAVGDYPAGSAELPRESDVLKTIQIVPRR